MTDSRTRAADYLILVEGGQPSNYSSWSPDLPGCVSVGDSVEECVANMRLAIEGHLASMESDGDPIPAASGPGVCVELAPPAAA